MINNVELFINEPYNAKLDLMSEVKVALQYSLADIRDISKRNSAYSKTVLLPGTKNNNYWLGNLFDINTDFTAFNPNKKTAARLLVNTETVIDGFLQLRKIKKLNNVDDEGNFIQYEVVLFNNAVDLMSELGEKKLNELDLGEYDHPYTYTNVVNSWNNTWEDGYVYPLYGTDTTTGVYQLTGGVGINKIYPAIFYKTVLNKMIEEAGFGWTGSLATNSQFDKEIIPYVGDGLPVISEAEQQRRHFRANTLNASNVVTANPYPAVAYFSAYVNESSDLRYRFNYDVPPLDPNNHWNTSLYEWNVDRSGTYHIEWRLDFRVDLKNDNTGLTVYAYPPGSFFNPRVRVKVALQRQVIGSSTWVTLDTQTLIDYTLPSQLTPSQVVNIPIFSTYTTPQLWFNAGDKVKLIILLEKPSDGYYTFGSSTGYAPKTLETTIVFFNTAFIKNYSYRNELVVGDIITWEQFLSDKLKQKDLLSDLIKRYNLFIQVDPDNPRNLILDTRTDFYDVEKFLDWTYKKDYSREDQIELLSELQFKEMLFSFKPDTGDLFNKDYTAKTGDIFGQFKYTFDNDFVKGEKKIESPFSPTPLDKTTFGAITPALNPATPKGNPRILYWGGMRSCGNWFYNNILQTSYPYAGYYDDPVSPELNIMFGNPKYEYYNDRQSVTSNYMYNLYWADYIRQIEDGKMLTAYFYLNEKDISYIKDNFNTKIFVKDSYYYVNKIIDYNPLENEITKVELLKIKDGVRWVNQVQGPISPGEVCPLDIRISRIGRKFYYVSDTQPITQDCCSFQNGIWDAETETCQWNPIYVDPDPIDIGDEVRNPYDMNDSFSTNGNVGVLPGDLVSGYDNIVGGTYLYYTQSGATQGVVLRNSQMVIGNNNQITSNGSIIGDNNIVSSDKSFIVGDNNTVTGLGYLINASDNVITEGNPVLIGAKGLTVSEGNKVYLGNEFKIDTESGDIQWKGATLSIPTEDELVKVVKHRFTPAEIGQLQNGFVLIEAPAIDTSYIDIIDANMVIDYQGTAYEGDRTLTIRYNTSTEYKMIGTNFLSATQSGVYEFERYVPATLTPQVIQGQYVYLRTLTDQAINGNSDITIILTYKIVST